MSDGREGASHSGDSGGSGATGGTGEPGDSGSAGQAGRPRPGGKTSVTVRIAGEEHTIVARAEPDYTRACARFVDERIAEIRNRSGLIEGHKAAILAALSITDELFQARDELERGRKETASRVRNLARRLESELTRTPASPAEEPGDAV